MSHRNLLPSLLRFPPSKDARVPGRGPLTPYILSEFWKRRRKDCAILGSLRTVEHVMSGGGCAEREIERGLDRYPQRPRRRCQAHLGEATSSRSSRSAKTHSGPGPREMISSRILGASSVSFTIWPAAPAEPNP